MTRFAFLLLLAATPALAQAPVEKRSLRHADYDAWRSIQSPLVSRDGRYAAYLLQAQDGDGEVVARNLATGAEWRHPTGARSSAGADPEGATPAAAPAAGARGARPTVGPRLQFSADGKFVAFHINPSKEEVAKARAAKVKPEEQPRPALGLMNVVTGTVLRFPNVRSFAFPEDAGSFVVYHREPKPEPGQTPAVRTPPSALTIPRRSGANPATAARRETGSDFVIRRLDTGTERVLADVTEYTLSKNGLYVVYAVTSKAGTDDGLFAVAPDPEAPPITLLAGKGKYQKLTWDEKHAKLAFISDRDDAGAQQPRFKVYLWEIGAPVKPTVVAAATTVLAGGWVLPALNVAPAARADVLVSAESPGFRPGWVVSADAGLSFALDGGRLFFSAGPPPVVEKPADPDAVDERVQLDLWHWKDDFIQPMQKVRAEQERKRSYRAVCFIQDRRVKQLADETLATVAPHEAGRWAVGNDDRPYRRQVGYGANLNDWYLVDVAEGTRTPVVAKTEWGVGISPAGRYAVWYAGFDWFARDLGTGTLTNLTVEAKSSFRREIHDTNDFPPAYGVGGWTNGDKSIFIYDRYDVWECDPATGGVKNVTAGLGRKQQTTFRLVKTDAKAKAYDPAKTLLFHADNEATRDTGFWTLPSGAGTPEALLSGPKSYTFVAKARDAETLLVTAQSFREFPDLQVCGPDFKELKKISDANPQQKELLWGTSETIKYQSADGTPLQGTLYKPERFDPTKKYPLMVYIYERLSQNRHRFRDPSPGTSINTAYYVSNGYLVLEPDITYTVGAPGQSAMKCVLPAISAVVNAGGVDEKAIGIQGHSWGGYQIAYMVTQTGRFKAAVAGAAVSDMVSAYDGIRWGTGMPRQFQYERTQSRIGGTLWQYPTRFLENSPIFAADRVTTPLMMLHNDADDAVPWYQSIEYYLALRRLGRECYLFNYNGEPHGLRRRANQKDWTVRMQQFFDHQLKGAPAPTWLEKGVPFLERDKK